MPGVAVGVAATGEPDEHWPSLATQAAGRGLRWLKVAAVRTDQDGACEAVGGADELDDEHFESGVSNREEACTVSFSGFASPVTTTALADHVERRADHVSSTVHTVINACRPS